MFPSITYSKALNLSTEDLLTLAQHWQTNHSQIYSKPIHSIRNIQSVVSDDEVIAWVVFPNLSGYLVLSNYSETAPVLAVSDSFTGIGLPVNHPMLNLLRRDIPNRIYRATHDVDEKILQEKAWSDLRSGNSLLKSHQQDSIILNETPTWGQGWTAGSRVFNLYTPNHWSTGCVATALAEVLAYYKWPPVGTGSNSYWDNDINLSVTYSVHEYDWRNTLQDYRYTFSTPEQKEAAALLSYHAAISVNMDFESYGSTADTYDGALAFHEYFRCSGHYMSASNTGFLDEVINNLIDGRPVILAVDGPVDHAIVADGYAAQYDLVHINYGWNGDSNGWYDIAGAFLPGYDYTLIGGVKGIVPNPMINETIEWVDGNTFILQWLTSYRLDADYYEVQKKLGTGIWSTLSSAITDTSLAITINSPGTYQYRVRASRDSIWWDWSAPRTVSVGQDVIVEFIIDMKNRPLAATEKVVLLGDIDPLGNIQNSPEFTLSSDNIYTTEVSFEKSNVGSTLLYRFGVIDSIFSEIESFNREYYLSPDTYQSLDTVQFNMPVSIDNNIGMLTGLFTVGAAYPNPFNNSLNIPVLTESEGEYEFRIYDLSGREVEVGFVCMLSSGKHVIRIDFNTFTVSSGIYFIQVRHGNDLQIKKCHLLK